MPRITKAEVREAAERDVSKNRKTSRKESRDTVRKEKDLRQFTLPVYSEGEEEITGNQAKVIEPVTTDFQPMAIPVKIENKNQDSVPTKTVSVSEFDPKLIPYSGKVKKVFALDEDVVDKYESQINQLTTENTNLLQEKVLSDEKIKELSQQLAGLRADLGIYENKVVELNDNSVLLTQRNHDLEEELEKMRESQEPEIQIDGEEKQVDNFSEKVATITSRIGTILLSVLILGVFGILVAKLLVWLITWLF